MHCRHVDIIDVKVMKDYKVELQFEDGTSGIVDISKIIPFKGIFEPLNDKNFFSKVVVNPEIGTICWENGADLSPTYLRKNIEQKK